MGTICCLEKVGLPLHQGSTQNDGGRARHFSKVLKKEEIGQVNIVEVQNGSFYRQKFKCALNVLHTFIKISTRWDFRDRRGELRNRRGQLKKIKEALAFSKAELAQKPRPIFFSRFVNICHMQSKLCGNHG
ncbi:hypothetical protein PS2_019032 [Malus domestica]